MPGLPRKKMGFRAPTPQRVRNAPRKARVFIAYRQGANEGDSCASWLFKSLNGASIDAEPDSTVVETYLDVRAPALSDWTRKWMADLKTARALILVCTPGIARRRGRRDWLYQEIEWWARNRKTAPIIVQPERDGENFLPEAIRARWPRVQRINWSADSSEEEMQVAIERIRQGLVISERGIDYEELRRLTWRNRALAVGAAIIGFLALGLFLMLRLETASRRQAERNLQLAYGPCIQVAWDHYVAGDLVRMNDALQSTPTHLRGWEWKYLRHLMDPSVRTLRTDGAIHAMAFSPKGDELAVLDGGGNLRLIDWRRSASGRSLGNTGERTDAEFVTPEGRELSVRHLPRTFRGLVYLSADRLASSGANGSTLIWNKRGDPSTALNRSPSANDRTAVVTSNNSGWVASGTKGGQVHIWAPGGGDEITLAHKLEFQGELTGLAISPDGDSVVTVFLPPLGVNSHEDFASLMNMTSGRIRPLPADHPVISVRFSNDGKRIYGVLEDCSIVSWDTSGNQPPKLLAPGIPNNYTYDDHLRLSSGGSILAALAGRRIVRVVDLGSGAVRSYGGHVTDISALSITPDGQTLAVAAANCIKLYDLSHPLADTVLNGPEESVTISADGRFFAAVPTSMLAVREVSLDSDSDIGKAAVWEAATLKPRLLNEFGALSIALSPDGTLVAIGREDTSEAEGSGGIIRMKRVKDESLLWERRSKDRVGYLTFSPKDGLLLSGGRGLKDNSVQVWNVRDGTLIGTLSGKDAVRFSPDGRTAAVGAFQADPSNANTPLFKLWSVPDFRVIAQTAPMRDRLRWVDFSPDGRRIVTVQDKAIRIWDARTAEHLLTLQENAQGLATAAVFSPDGRRIAAATEYRIRIWDARTGDALLDMMPRKGCTSLAWIASGLIAQTDSSELTLFRGDNSSR